MGKLSRALFASLAVALCLYWASPSGTSLASGGHFGSNAFNFYRLPYAHGLRLWLMQGYDTCFVPNENGVYNGDHCGSFIGYSLDFETTLDYLTPIQGTRVLAVTSGYACQNTGSGLGLFIVEAADPAPGTGRSGLDYFFYGHNDSSWLSSCSNGWTAVYQSQVLGVTGCTGNCGGPHIHLTVQNPGQVCFCGFGTSIPVPLSGLDFTPYRINRDSCCWQDQDYFISDSAMAGDDNALPQPNFNVPINVKWIGWGGVYGPGSTRNNGGGPGVHGWGNGLVQDFDGYPGYAPGPGTILLQNGWPSAFWVHGAIWSYYVSLGGPYSGYGYPTTNEYTWNGSGRRQDFQGGSICWNGSSIVNCVTSTPIIVIDTPPANSSQNQPFPVNGWAIDYASTSGTGVDQVDVWQAPSDAQGHPSGSAAFVGHAAYGGYRPDVGAAYGSQFTYSAYSVTVSGLASGYHIFYVYEHSTNSGAWSSPATRVALLSASAPVLAMDSPQPGNVQQPFQVNGWAADLGSTAGSGIDAVHIYIYPSDQYGNTTGPYQYFTGAVYGYYRADVGISLVQQGYCACFYYTGFGYETSVSGLPSGYHLVVIYEHSTIASGWTATTRVVYMIGV
jgi:hypothetical protein